MHTLPGGREGIEAAWFNRDGTLVLSDGVSGSELEDAARTWDVASGRLRHRYPAGMGSTTEQPLEIWYAILSFDSRRVVATTEDWTRIWDSKTGDLVYTFHGAGIFAVYSPNGRLLATGGWSGPLHIRNASIGHTLHTLHPNEDMYSLAFSPDSKLLATTGFDQAEIWGRRQRPPSPQPSPRS
jgi:WD40 repeat protein